jgi:hypothetical protein
VRGAIRYEGRISEFLDAGELETDLVFSRIPPGLATRLEERFGALRGQTGRFELRVLEKEVPDVLAMSLEADAQVVSLTPHRASLEAIFLSAVEASSAERRKAAP